MPGGPHEPSARRDLLAYRQAVPGRRFDQWVGDTVLMYGMGYSGRDSRRDAAGEGADMTLDPLIYALAQARCKASGFDNSQCVQEMAEAIQSAAEDVEADFMNACERETKDCNGTD